MRFTFKYIFYLFLLLLGQVSYAQQTKGIKPVKPPQEIDKGVTRAVIVGISDYQNEKIPDLQYAHKDAALFAEYLQSPEGGGIDSSHITVLLNEQATSGQFVAALYGLIEDGKEGDNTIIYFSGHGDVESTTISQPGFLLCWDAPHRIYMGGGTFGLTYLQEIISTISAVTKSKVIVITDACRAGKLAGSNIGGAQATAANLAKQYANEIKILSCQPNEFALESQAWGGGRGVFSYYFLRGIQGLADNNGDNIVTLTEISRFLEDHVTPAVDPHSQIPMVVGNRQTEISKVNPEVLARLKNENNDQTLSTINSRSIDIDQDLFIDTTRYDQYKRFLTALNSKHLLYPVEGSAWTIYHQIKEYEELDPYIGLMKRNLAAALQDEAQQAINNYISADTEELKKRWNYDTKYQKYPEQLYKAASLLGTSHFFYKPLMSRYYYFKGLVSRLNAERHQIDSLYDLSIKYQDTALIYQPQAVHAINEIGYVHHLLEKDTSSIQYYQEAASLVPDWPLLWSNMSTSYLSLDSTQLAQASAEKALSIDSNYILGHYNLAKVLSEKGDIEKAKNLYYHTLELDSTFVPTYLRLGFIESDQKNYDLSETYYLKSLEYDSITIWPYLNLAHVYIKKGDIPSAEKYFKKAKAVNPNSLDAYQGMIELHFYSGNTVKAKEELIKYVADYPNDEYAYYLIASIYAKSNNINQSLEYLELALSKGFKEIKTLEEDENLESIRPLDEYQKLINKYQPLKN